MGNQTTVGTLGIGGAIGTILSGTLRFYFPDLMNSIPGIDGAITVVVAAGIAWGHEGQRIE